MSTAGGPRSLQCFAVEGIGEVAEGDDLALLISDRFEVEHGDVLVVTSKIVSKAEGRLRRGDRTDLLEDETVRVLARRGETAIVRNRQGLVLAGAGIDASNTAVGTVLLLPEDPDHSAAALRQGIAERTGRRVGVIVSDTAGRAWRHGQTDIAIGAAGFLVADDHAGRVDPYGNELAVTVTALADEVASAADLVKGKLHGYPVAVVRGLAHLVVDDGPGARSLQRSDSEDLFGLGSRQAVLGALGAVQVDQAAYGAPLSRGELVAALAGLPAGAATLSVGEVEADGQVSLEIGVEGSAEERGRLGALVAAVCFASGWEPADPMDQGLWPRRFSPCP